jgi:hypothetical protein
VSLLDSANLQILKGLPLASEVEACLATANNLDDVVWLHHELLSYSARQDSKPLAGLGFEESSS